MKKLRTHQNKLCDDLFIKILAYVPTKSLLRFRCLSKSWLALISETYKRNMLPLAMIGFLYNRLDSTNYRPHYINSCKGLCDGSYVDTNIEFLSEHHKLLILDSSNGFLLCQDSQLGIGTKSLYVANPLTKEWFKIPNPNNSSRMHTAILDFNPLVSNHFNILKFVLNKFSNEKFHFEVYSSRTGEWIAYEIGDVEFEYFTYYHRSALSIFNGVLHVLGTRTSVLIGIDQWGKICRRNQLPYKYNPSKMRHSARLGVSGGYLHYAIELENECNVWAMDDYERGSWVFKYSFPIRYIKHELGILRSKDMQMIQLSEHAFHPDLDVIFLLVNGKLHSFNRLTKKVAELCSDKLCGPFIPYSPCYFRGLPR